MVGGLWEVPMVSIIEIKIYPKMVVVAEVKSFSRKIPVKILLTNQNQGFIMIKSLAFYLIWIRKLFNGSLMEV